MGNVRDLDGNQGVDFLEFQRGLARAGAQVSELDAMILLLRFDRNSDGRLQHSEFVRMLQNSEQSDEFGLSEQTIVELGIPVRSRATPSPLAATDSQQQTVPDTSCDRRGCASSMVGARVQTEHGCGVVRFEGPTQFASGDWLGIQLDQAEGRNDGMVDGQRYFGPVA